MKVKFLTDQQLLQFGQYFNIPINQVVMKDEINIKKNGGYIINMQSSADGNGTHWVACYKLGDLCIYFDSFGIYPPLEVVKQCKKHDIIYSNQQIQALDSTACGYYCIAFLFFVHINKSIIKRGRTLHDIIKMLTPFLDLFENDTSKNDKHLLHYFNDMLK